MLHSFGKHLIGRLFLLRRQAPLWMGSGDTAAQPPQLLLDAGIMRLPFSSIRSRNIDSLQNYPNRKQSLPTEAISKNGQRQTFQYDPDSQSTVVMKRVMKRTKILLLQQRNNIKGQNQFDPAATTSGSIVSTKKHLEEDGLREALEYHQLFEGWNHIIRSVPRNNHDLIHKYATILDRLTRQYLQDVLQVRQPSSGDRRNNSIDMMTAQKYVETTMNVWGRRAFLDRQAAVHANELFELLHYTWDEVHQAQPFVPTEGVRLSLLHAWSDVPNVSEASAQVQEWFDVLYATPEDIYPPTSIVNILLKTASRTGCIESMEKVLSKTSNIPRDRKTYKYMLETWLHSNRPNRNQKALEIIKECVHRDHSNSSHQMMESSTRNVTSEMITRFLSVNRQDPQICHEALSQWIELQEEEKHLHPTEGLSYFVNRQHFLMTMNALAAVGNVDGVAELYRIMEQVPLAETDDSHSLYQGFCILLVAIRNRGSSSYVEQIEKLLRSSEDRFFVDETKESENGNYAFNILLDAIAKSNMHNKRSRIEEIIEYLKGLAERTQNDLLLPDKVSYTTLCRVIAAENQPEALREIVSIVKYLESSPKESMKPDQGIYFSYLEALSQTTDGSASQNAKRFFGRLRTRFDEGLSDVLPDVRMYTILLRMYVDRGQSKRSDETVDQVIAEFLHGNESCRPSEAMFLTAVGVWQYNYTLKAWPGAYRLFMKMKHLFESGVTECRPSERIFGSMMIIAGNCNQGLTHTIADLILDEMQMADVKPNSVILSSYIRACAACSGSKEERASSLHAAERVFESLRSSSTGVNSHSYVAMLHCYCRLITDSEERQRRLKEIFISCSEDGWVDDRFLMSIKRFATETLYLQLTVTEQGANPGDVTSLPEDWSRNTRADDKGQP